MPETATAIAVMVFGAGATASAVGAVAGAVAIGIVAGAVIGAATALITGEDILESTLKGALIGGVTAGVFKGASLAWDAYSTAAEAAVDVSVNANAPIKAASAVPTSTSAPDPTKFADATTKGIGAGTNANLPSVDPKTMTDASAKIWAGVGQGAAQGIAGVGASLMEGENYQDALEEKRKYEDEKMAKNFSTSSLATPKKGTMIFPDSEAPTAGTSATAAAPSADVNAQYQAATGAGDSTQTFAKQTAKAAQGTENNWWMSHFQTSAPQQQQVKYA